MDSFTITHYQHLFPVDEFKVQEVISQEYLEYGAQVENSSMVSCLKNFRFSEESELYEQAELYMANHYNKVGVNCSWSIKAFICFSLTSYDAWKVDCEQSLFCLKIRREEPNELERNRSERFWTCEHEMRRVHAQWFCVLHHRISSKRERLLEKDCSRSTWKDSISSSWTLSSNVWKLGRLMPTQWRHSTLL